MSKERLRSENKLQTIDPPDREYAKTGETGSLGWYVCTNCTGDTDFYPQITEEGQHLPKCPFCGNTVWEKLNVG